MRGLVGDITSRIERAGLKIVAMKMIVPTEEQVRRHLPMSDEEWVARLGKKTMMGFEDLEATPKEIFGTEDLMALGQNVVDGIMGYLTSGPVVCMVVEGIESIAMVRKLAGHTLPFKAEAGTIRGDYSVDSPSIANTQRRAIHNILHASENVEEAANEVKLWFDDNEMHDYLRTSEGVMYGNYY